MTKRLILSLVIIISFLISPLSASTSHAGSEADYLTIIGDWSCAAPKICSAITPIMTEFGFTLSIVAWDGVGKSWKNGTEIDLTSDPINKKIIEENDIRKVETVALMCMSVGNCEGMLMGVGDDSNIITPDGKGFLLSRTTKKPFKSIYFSISQIDSVWQTPRYIETLSFTHKAELVAMNRHASIHCASHGNCVIAGNSGGPTRERLLKSFGKNLFGEEQIDTKPFLITQTDGVWGAPQFPMVKKFQNNGSTFFTLKCETNLDCVIQGQYVPELSLMNKLKSQNNMQREWAKAVLSLGFTLTLSNGSWGEPKTNLGGAFKKGPFPKGDPKVQFIWTANDNNFNDLTNMMPCIKSEDCLIGPISPLGQIQPAGVGNPTWPVKCPRVVDSVKTPQPKVLGFKFDGNGETYTRLTDGDSVASKSPGDLVGCYAVLKWFIPTSKGANSYHIGTINRDASGYYWQNPDGNQWRLTLSGSILTTDKNNPYYDEGRQFITY